MGGHARLVAEGLEQSLVMAGHLAAVALNPGNKTTSFQCRLQNC